MDASHKKPSLIFKNHSNGSQVQCSTFRVREKTEIGFPLSLRYRRDFRLGLVADRSGPIFYLLQARSRGPSEKATSIF